MAQRTTPKKTAEPSLTDRFRAAAAPEPQPEPMRIPSRPAQIKLQAINDNDMLMTLITDDGMQVSNVTVSYEQWRAMVEGTLPWMELERPENHYDDEQWEEVPPGADLTVVKRDTTLVGPDGHTPIGEGS